VEEETMMYPRLGGPFVVAGLRLPNRLVLPPLVTWTAALDGTVTPESVAHYRASMGPGLVIVEASAVAPEGRLAQKQLGIFEDRHVEGLAALAAIIHGAGAIASIQIHHAGSSTNTVNTFGQGLLAPSTVPSSDGEIPQALDEAGIERIIRCFATAARRAREAGFDAVEVHAAHGYLVSQFLSPFTNRRTDGWGGSLQGRARFLREILARIRAQEGSRLLAYCRLGVADGRSPGLRLEEGIRVAQLLEDDGVPLLDVSNGIGDPTGIAPAGSRWSDRLHLGAAVKRAVRVPVIGVGGIGRPIQAEEVLAEGLVDLVAVGRAMLADPAWARKALEGRPGDIIPCRDCKRCQHFGHAERCPARTA
jgi:2,4-dienoyl-CoA reductase-like NADH-dependent reductase (Old Yellow Enzyme family)